MEFRILGPLEVLDGDRPVPLPRGRGRALLALLVLRAGEVVSTDQLIDWLWGERPPPTAITALHGFVSTLRKRLEPARGAGEAPAVLETRPPGYVLAIDRGEVDAHRFRRLLEEAADAPALREGSKASHRTRSVARAGPGRLQVRALRTDEISQCWRSSGWQRSRSGSTRTWRSAGTPSW